VPEQKVIFRVHALQRMLNRGITVQEVRQVLATGEVIEDYPNDLPFPSRLMLGWCGGQPLHVVAAEDREAGETIVITVYEPDPTQWENDFRRKRQ
jgi:hypothetical protein